MEKVWILFVIWFNAWQDVKKREISFWLIALAAVIGVGHLILGDGNIREQIVPLALAGMFAGLSVLSGGGFGMGDALLLIVLGLHLPMEEYLLMLCLALVFAAVWSLLLVAVKKKGRKTEIPFVPFLLFGYVGGLVLCA